ncbi:MAG: DUF3618 domain-containing protein [Nocardioidaceae bacterium]
MSAAARTPDQIAAEIADTRNQLAGTIDQLVYRASPKTLVKRQVAATKSKFVDDNGKPNTAMIGAVVGGAVGFVGLIVVIRKIVS